jgi:hypothetical protein
VIEHKEPEDGRQIGMLALRVNAADERGKGDAFVSRNLLERRPKGSLQTDAGFVPIDRQRPLQSLGRKFRPTVHHFPLGTLHKKKLFITPAHR